MFFAPGQGTLNVFQYYMEKTLKNNQKAVWAWYVHDADTCGECDFTIKERLVEMLIFQVFEDYYRFPKVDENSRLKALENKILVSICTTLE